jgi:hypothetical protein
MVGLVDAIGDEPAVVIGHDWGAPVARIGFMPSLVFACPLDHEGQPRQRASWRKRRPRCFISFTFKLRASPKREFEQNVKGQFV